jgi:hypothetical protein
MSICTEILGIAGDFPRIVSSNPLVYRCFGQSYINENLAIQNYVANYGYATHLWSENITNNNQKLFERLGKNCGSIKENEYGKLVQFEKPVIMWLVCNSTLSGIKKGRCCIPINNPQCPINRANSNNYCKQYCWWWIAVRMSVIKEVLIISDNGIQALRNMVTSLQQSNVIQPTRNILADWLDKHRWLESAYSRFYFICDLKDKLQLVICNKKQRRSYVFLKITYVEDVSSVRLSKNDFEYHDSDTCNFVPASTFFSNNRQKLRLQRGEFIEVKRRSNKGNDYVKKALSEYKDC